MRLFVENVGKGVMRAIGIPFFSVPSFFVVAAAVRDGRQSEFVRGVWFSSSPSSPLSVVACLCPRRVERRKKNLLEKVEPLPHLSHSERKMGSRSSVQVWDGQEAAFELL